MRRIFITLIALCTLSTVSAQGWLDKLKKVATETVDKATDGALTQLAVIGSWEYSAPAVKLEINPRSPVIKNLDSLKKTDADLAKLVLEQLYDNALLSAGLLENPRAMANRLNEILSKVKA